MGAQHTAVGGWFFDEADRVEPVQILRYAHRALELHTALCGTSLEAEFVQRLAPIRCVHPELKDGRDLWRKRVVRRDA